MFPPYPLYYIPPLPMPMMPLDPMYLLWILTTTYIYMLQIRYYLDVYHILLDEVKRFFETVSAKN